MRATVPHPSAMQTTVFIGRKFGRILTDLHSDIASNGNASFLNDSFDARHENELSVSHVNADNGTTVTENDETPASSSRNATVDVNTSFELVATPRKERLNSGLLLELAKHRLVDEDAGVSNLSIVIAPHAIDRAMSLPLDTSSVLLTTPHTNDTTQVELGTNDGTNPLGQSVVGL